MRKNKITILVLISIFILPIIISFMLFYFHSHFTLKTTNKGRLINPPINIKILNAALNKKTWKIIYLSTHCKVANAKKIVFFLHQIRSALSKDRNRIELLVWQKKYCLYQLPSDIKRLELTNKQIQTLLTYFRSFHLPLNGIFLVDPFGNLFMYYNSDSDFMNVYKDLTHVLSVSQIG